MYLDALCLPIKSELGQSIVPSRSLQELFPLWTLVQGIFFIPVLDIDAYLKNAEFIALSTWLTQRIQAFSV